jgi:hypothetical protein
MSDIPEYIVAAINRINDFLPNPIELEELQPNIKKRLPFGLSGAYDYYQTEIFNTPFIVAGACGDDGVVTPSVLTGQKNVIKKQTGIDPIFVFNRIAAYLFQRYAKNNIDIVAGGRQIFLPSIYLVAVREKPQLNIETDKPPVLFQLTVLYHLERENIDGITMRLLTQKLQTSYATVNRCVRWMTDKGFITLVGGKEKQIRFNYQGKALWEMALPYMDTPIDSIVYVSEIETIENGLVSEQNALAEYSLLSGGPKRIAISKETYKNLRKENIQVDPMGESGVEIWKYNPLLLSDTRVVDRLSLYLILRHYEDERVQIELENMLNEITW